MLTSGIFPPSPMAFYIMEGQFEDSKQQLLIFDRSDSSKVNRFALLGDAAYDNVNVFIYSLENAADVLCWACS